MSNMHGNIPRPVNEPVYSYAPGAPERAQLESTLRTFGAECRAIPLRIGGRRVKTGKLADCVEPHDHGHVIGRYHKAGKKEAEAAVAAAVAAQPAWAAMAYQDRASIFLKAADLLSGRYRARINAATMLNQSKNPFQAEIDSACELADFWRFNAYYGQELVKGQPDYSPRGTFNYMEYRPLEGFVFAVTPFNFTSIAGNLPTAPLLFGNVAIWKPASTAVLAADEIMAILEEAGLPPGVINFLPGSASEMAAPLLESEHLAGVHFTGSTEVFQDIWRTVGGGIGRYRGYPRLVGETGGKDFVVAHASADSAALAVALVRGAFEYQGQKCSAASRAYVPKSLWPKVRRLMGEMLAEIKMGPVQDFSNFVNAVIDRQSFEKCRRYITRARKSSSASVVFGGGCDAAKGYFVQPTVIEARDPGYETMREEIFGPILTVYVYPDNAFDKALQLCDATSPYALTGAIFARDRAVVVKAMSALRQAAGNFYINDKPTGAVVGQQPFGGARASGTNDKAGSPLNLLRWVSARSIKENFDPPRDYRYPFMGT